LLANTGANQRSILMAVSVICSILWVSWVSHYGFDMADEGYYWYGSQRMLHGGMPMRDYLSYDIGRYAWGALFMHLAGDDGIVGARLSAALFQLLTISLGVWLVLRTMGDRFSLVVTAVTVVLTTVLLNLWVHPYYKSFDYGAGILVIAMLALMVTSLTVRAWFIAGLLLGVIAIIGRNHGVYGAFSAFLFVLFIGVKLRDMRLLVKLLLAFVAGVVVGFSPTFALALLVDGFAQAFITTLRDLIQSGSANIGLPIPWPWVAVKDQYGTLYFLMKILQGFAFIALLAAPVAALAHLARRPYSAFTCMDKFLLALACTGLGYAHYAFSRSDLTHLSHSIAPALLIILCFGIMVGRPMIASLFLLCMSVLVLAPEKPYLAHILLQKKLSTISVNNVPLRVFSIDAMRFNAAEHAFSESPSARSSFLALPNAPGLHAMNKTDMKIWEIYALSKRPAAFEAAEIERLQTAPPEMILLSDDPLDFQDELRYSKMHPLTYQWILQHYHRAAVPQKWENMWQVYRRNP
jgi:hypothetical protein